MPGLTFVSFCLKRNGFASFAFKRRKKNSFTDRCKQFYDPSSMSVEKQETISQSMFSSKNPQKSTENCTRSNILWSVCFVFISVYPVFYVLFRIVMAVYRASLGNLYPEQGKGYSKFHFSLMR